MSSKIQVALVDETKLIISFAYNPSDVERVKALSERTFHKPTMTWRAPASAGIVRELQELFPGRLEMSNEVLALIDEAKTSDRESAKLILQKALGDIDTSEVPPDHALMKTINPVTGEPQGLYQHQRVCLALGGRSRRFGCILPTGTGKTLLALSDAVWAWRRGSIDTLFVLCPNNVKTQYVNPRGDMDAVKRFVPADIPVNAGCVLADRNPREQRLWDQFLSVWENKDLRAGHLNILAANYESLDRLYEWYADHLNKRTMIVADESTRIAALPKKHRLRGPQNRSAKAIALRQQCAAARFMSGTPIIKSPLKAWSQLEFLDRALLPWGSYSAFKAHMCVTGGFQGKQVLFYKNEDDLALVLAGCTFRVEKGECVDLPPKVYQRIEVAMTKEQRVAYEEMRKEGLVILDQHARKVDVDEWIRKYGGSATQDEIEATGLTVHNAPIVLTVRLRLRQILSGYLPIYEETEDGGRKIVDYKELVEPSKNPKLTAALEIVEDAGDQKVVIWGQFRRELGAMAELLRGAGIGFVEYHGGVAQKDRLPAKDRFMNDPECRVFLGHPAAAGTGTDGLQVAGIMIFLSNNEATETRVQAEDRIHRIGQNALSCTIFDIVVPGTVDTKTISVLRADKKLSDTILGDDPKEWI